jgi:multiple sugar transport system substrate-binding protein
MTTGYALMLNTDLFSERSVSIPKDGNWTYEEFLDALKALTYDTNGKGNPDVYGFNSFIEPGYYNSFGIIMSDGAQFVNKDNGEYCFDYPEAVSGLRKLWDLKHTYNVTHPQFGIMSENQAWTSFLKGKVAVYTVGSWAIPYLRNIQSNYNINFTVANFPTGKAEIPITISANTCSYAVFKQDDAKKKEMCIEFIKSLTSKEGQDDLARFGYFPVRKSGENLYRNDKEMSIIQKSLSYSEPLPKLYNWDEIDLVLQSRIKSAINGEITPEQALQESKVLVERYINNR